MDTEHIELRGGKREGAGRPKKLKTQVKDWITAHPQAIATLKDKLYQMGISGDREAAMYMIDRFEGKPKAVVGLPEEEGKALAVLAFVELAKLQDAHRKSLTDGNIIEGEVINATEQGKGPREETEGKG